jgi:AraC family transcriptional regulator
VSSRDAGWTSLLLEVHTGVRSSEPYASIPTGDQIVGVALSGHYVSEVFRDGRWRRGVYHPGAICVHQPVESVRYRFPPPEPRHANFTTAMLYLPHAQMAAAVEQLRRPGQRGSAPRLSANVARDLTIAQMTSALLQGMLEKVDDLYAETAAAWLAVHLVNRYGSLAGIDDHRNAGAISDARLARVIEFMSAQFDRPLTLDQLASEACVSRFHFARLFRSKVGQSPFGFLAGIRLEAARRMLITSDLSAAEIAAACGYRTASHFSAAFSARHGLSPTAFRLKQGGR